MANQTYYAELGGKLKNGFFKRNQFVKLDSQFNAALCNFAQQCEGKDTYVCAYLYESQDGSMPDISSCNIIASPYLDFDGDIQSDKDYNELKSSVLIAIGAINQELGISPDLLEIYFSGAKGFHIIIPYAILGLTPSKELNDDFKKFASYLKEKVGGKHIDTAIYDRRRLLRVAGSINSKTGLYKVPVTSQMLFSMNSYSSIKEWASQPRTVELKNCEYNEKARRAWNKIITTTKEPEKKIKKLPDKKIPLMPCSEKLLREGMAQGNRNNAAIALSSSLLQSGMDSEEAWSRLCEWNQKNDPPIEEYELSRTFRSAISMVGNGHLYGCSAYKDLGMCDEKCPIRRSQKTREKKHDTKNSYYSRAVRSA